MKIKALHTLALIAICGIAALTFSSNSGGITGQSTAGCTCHGAENTNTVVSLSGQPAGGYVAGTSYPLTLTVSNPNYTAAQNAAGFDLTVSAGSLSGAPTNTSITAGTEIFHTSPKSLTSSSASWTFNWTAPSASTGAVTISVAGNVVNGNGNDNGDAWRKNSFTVNPAVVVVAPTITNVNHNVLGPTSAQISATVNANNNTTTMTVEYGLTPSYGSTANMTPAVITGSTPTNTSATLNGLTPATVYNYRVRAAYNATSVFSSNGVLTTKPNGITEVKKASFNLYPNPAETSLIVSNNSGLGTVKAISVFNALGQKQAAPYSILNGQMQISIERLPAGTYTLMLYTNEGTASNIFLKK